VDNIKETALAICLLIAFLSLISIIAPSNKFSNIFKVFINILTLLLILKPFTVAFSDNSFLDSNSYSETLKEYKNISQNAMSRTIDKTIDFTLKEQILSTLKSDGIKIHKVKNIFTYNENNLFISEVRIYADKQYKKDDIIKSVSKIIDTKIEVIYI